MKRILSIIFGILITSLAYADRVAFGVVGGANISGFKNNVAIPLANQIVNYYNSSANNHIAPVVGLELGYVFNNINYSPWDVLFDVAFYNIKYNAITGRGFFPYVNGTLNYQFKGQSQALMFEALFIYTIPKLQPFVILGIGRSKNRLYDYNELPANQALNPNFTTQNFPSLQKKVFTYELGLGAQRSIFKDKLTEWLISAEYHYFHLGEGQLGLLPNQINNNRFTMNLHTNVFLLGLKVFF